MIEKFVWITILAVVMAVMTGCAGSEPNISSTSTSTSWKTVYIDSGATGIRLTQANVVPTKIEIAQVKGTIMYVELPACQFGFDIAILEPDPVDLLFWLGLTVTVEYDPSTITCGVSYRPVVGTVSIVNSSVTGEFELIPN